MISSLNTSGTASTKTLFAYDPDGTRISSTENAGTVQAKTIRYLVDRNQAYAQVVEERVVAGEDNSPDLGKLATVYTFEDDLLANTACAVASSDINCAPGDTRVLHYDGLGSTRFLSDSGGGTTDKYAYEAFGEVDSVGSSGRFDNAFQFTGERFQANTGTVYLRARSYAPGTGRFLGMDSWMGSSNNPVSLNKYLYADVNPVMGTDPSGNETLISINTGINIGGFVGNIIGITATALIVSSAAQIVASIPIAKACAATHAGTAVTGKLTCGNGHIPIVFMEKMVVGDVFDHVLKSQSLHGSPSVLTRTFTNIISNRVAAMAFCAAGLQIHKSATGTSCDEYPFASSNEGGVNATVADVTLRNNLSQGGVLSLFYRYCKVPAGVAVFNTYVVIPVISAPTRWQCK